MCDMTIGMAARVLDNVAGMFTAIGLHEEADPLYRRALAIMEKRLGPQHPDVAKTLEFHAGALQMLGREAEADGLYVHAKAITDRHAGGCVAPKPATATLRFAAPTT